MEIIQIRTGGMLCENAYLVACGKRCLVVDPGAEADRILAAIDARGLTCEAVLLTHGHYDHIGAVAPLQARGARVYIHKADAPMLSSDEKSLARGVFGAHLAPVVPDALLSGGETLTVAGFTVRVLHTPGHTPGGVCYAIDDALFTGDTLFCGDVGRSDFPGGSGEQLLRSIREQLFTLPGNYTVYPGHEEATTLDEERRNNPYFGERHGV